MVVSFTLSPQRTCARTIQVSGMEEGILGSEIFTASLLPISAIVVILYYCAAPYIYLFYVLRAVFGFYRNQVT